MFESLVGSTNAERVLLFLAARDKGYAQEIAETFDIALSQVQRILDHSHPSPAPVSTPGWVFHAKARQRAQPPGSIGLRH